MARCEATIKFQDKKSLAGYMDKTYGFQFEFNESDILKEYKNVELDDILVSLTAKTTAEGETHLVISKLVSLKAFLLSKDSGTDINSLVKKIDKILNLSMGTLESGNDGIAYDECLSNFFHNSKMHLDLDSKGSLVILDDGKRKARMRISQNNSKVHIDFNSIEEI